MIHGTRRRILQGTAALGMAAIMPARLASAQDLSAQEKELHAAAQKEGEVTWYTGQMQAEPSEAIGAAFTARYPGVKVNVVRSTSQVAFQRLSQDMRARVQQCDVFSTMVVSHQSFLRERDLLMQYRPANAAGMLEVARAAGDPDGYFHVSYLEPFLMIRRNDRVSEADMPKSWTDLLDPRWKGQIAIGHPGFSGAIGVWAVLMKRIHGDDYLKKLERNSPQIGRSSADPITVLNAGERTIGAAVAASSTLLSLSRGNPLAPIYPTDGTVIVPAPSSALAQAKNPNAAKLFMEFMAGPAYSATIRKFFAESLRGDVPPPDGAQPLDKITLLTATAEEIENGVPRVQEEWRDIFGV